MQPRTKKAALILAIIVVLVVSIALYVKRDSIKSGFSHGKNKGRTATYIGGPLRKKVELQMIPGREPSSDQFMSDAYHWPTSGTFGNLSDTNPYWNYAGHSDMWYPIYNDMHHGSWGRSK